MSRTGLTRELLRWILSLGLSHPIKNARRDFSNGYLLAEILQRYYPHEVALHSFDNGATSEKRKSDNWKQLEKICKKKGFKLSPKDVEGVINCKEECLIPLLERVYKKVTSASPADRRETSSRTSRGGGARDEGPTAGYASKFEGSGKPNSSASKGGPAANPRQGAFRGQQHFVQSEPVAEDVHSFPQQYPSSPFPIEPMRDYSYPANEPVLRSPRRSYTSRALPEGGYSSPAASQQQYWDPFEFGKYSYEGGAPVVASVSTEHQADSYARDSYARDSYAEQEPSRQEYDTEGRSLYSYYSQQDRGGGVGFQPSFSSSQPPSYHATPPSKGAQEMSYSHSVGKENTDSPRFAPSSPPEQSVLAGYSSQRGDQGEEAKKFAPKYNPTRKPKQADIKAGSKYWELGKLGPDLERKEIVEKRSARDRMKEFSSEIRKQNARVTKKSPKEASTLDSSKAYSARQRALDFAKNIPKPGSAPRASTSPSKKGNGGREGFDNISELDRLMEQHEASSQQINSMRHQLERQLKLASI
ncbi:calponin-homology (CH) domain-containing protein [Chloropicon primus]|uniref:Calponin-homology (CH) domain-containing protein n=1 Tax=Chloropicon primus TaxID=1764295 RepID=A0A5B8MPN5_9CHLO|nr:hypothetical protein A3770_05p38380 [Chloropicon primus]UPR00536.1 calponin-homology (CH) domain-containing protein [Chloropicon primus]|eukprot:QDZ21320.1 hypothetical protein A3770_05p38380 [Chloropicon primus]